MLKRILFVVVALCVFVGSGRAEKINMSPAQLRKTATHIVTGKVTAIKARTETTNDWQYTRYTATVRVAACEKGSGIKSGDLVQVRYWHRVPTKEKAIRVDTRGHRGLPKTGEFLRVYLACNAYDGFTQNNHDGGYNVIGANGFERTARKR